VSLPSTAIGKIDYDDETLQLFVSFVTNGRRYVYFDVPRVEYDAFRHSFSKGSYFNAHIRDRYDHALVFDPKRDASDTTEGPLTRPSGTLSYKGRGPD
jgi:hypothetical protein